MQSTSEPSDDPFDEFLKPPANETATDRRERLKREADAKAVSEAINADLRKERTQMKKGTVKILLLGQAESGKSTTLKSTFLECIRLARELIFCTRLPSNVRERLLGRRASVLASGHPPEYHQVCFNHHQDPPGRIRWRSTPTPSQSW